MDAALIPRLRGVFHQYAFFAALLAGVALVVLAEGMIRTSPQRKKASGPASNRYSSPRASR